MTSLTFTWLNNREIDKQKQKTNWLMDKWTNRHTCKKTQKEKREKDRWMNEQTQMDG